MRGSVLYSRGAARLKAPLMELGEAAKASILGLGGPENEPVVDFLSDPGGALRTLKDVAEIGGAGLVVRVAPSLGPEGEGFGPAPVDPAWLRVMHGAPEVGLAPLRGGDAWVRKAARIELERVEISCCEAPPCDLKKTVQRLSVVLEGQTKGAAEERFVVAEQVASDAQAPSWPAAIAPELARALDVPSSGEGEAIEGPGEKAPSLPVPRLARFAVRVEGARTVIRDHGSTGPKAGAKGSGWTSAIFFAVAVAFWVQLYLAYRGGAGQGAMVAYGALGALFTLAGYAFFGVARFSARYGARSEPMVAIGGGRVTVTPWVSREGAVDARPEGRLGAAIPLEEVRASSIKPRKEKFAVELDTDHGPMDALTCDDEEQARYWSRTIDRAVDAARHPKRGATAKQRARARAKDPG